MRVIKMYEIFFILAYFSDIFLTYRSVSEYQKLYPKKDATEIELNAIMRFFWRTFGLKIGTIITTIAMFPVLLTLLFLIAPNVPGFLYYFMGIYTMIFILHIASWNIIEEKKRVRRQRAKKRKN